MYVLIKQCGDDISVVAVSESKNLLRQKLVREAKRILRDYLDPDDPYDRKKKDELFRSLNEIGDKTEWDDGEEGYILSFRIEKAPLFKVN